MSLQTPTTSELADTIVSQIEASIGQAVPLLPKAFLRVLARVLAGAVVLIYKYAGFIFLQLFVSQATMRATTILGRELRPLVEWGRLVGVGDPEPATQAELVVDVSVELQTGFLPANSQLVYSPTGVVYLTTSAVALDAPTVQATIRASSDPDGGGGAGAIGNLEPGDVVSFASPLPNIGRDAVVVSQAVTGADGESEDAYRARIIRRFQRRPQGGAYADYQQWGEEPPGILNVYPYTSSTPGEVDVYVEATPASSGSPDGIPTPAQLDEVAASIELDQQGLASRRPAGVGVNVFPITRSEFDVQITGLSPDLPSSRLAIESAVDELLRSREPFIVGLSTFPRRDRITLAAVSGVADDAASAIGGSIAEVELSRSGVPLTAYTLGSGEKAKAGEVTFQEN